MAPAKEKWVRRFIIPETARHKKGFTIYKVTSVVFSRSSREEVSKVSVWKRYNDFKKLYSELSHLYSKGQGKEPFPSFSKSRFFGRFEAEVIEERKECALRFLEFIGRHSHLYSSVAFVKFFETSHADSNANDCSLSTSSDTSEDDRHNSYVSSAILQNVSRTNESLTLDLEGEKGKAQETGASVSNERSPEAVEAETSSLDASHESPIEEDSLSSSKECNELQASNDEFDRYILIAAAHTSAAVRHESILEYEEAFTQYKMAISNLLSGVRSDPDSQRAATIRKKIAKYLEKAERLYNKHLNCNISALSKPATELQYYKILKITRENMIVRDTRENCTRIVKTVEKVPGNDSDVSAYILRGQIPYMVRLYACVETDTAVFLVLQHARHGKLWDYISSRHKATDNNTQSPSEETNVVCEEPVEPVQRLEESTNESRLNSDAESANVDQRIVASSDSWTSNGRTRETARSADSSSSEPYNANTVPTTELLQKSQQLLLSVNATLRKSNSIASRLNESKRLMYQPESYLTNGAEHDADSSQNSSILSKSNGEIANKRDEREKDAEVSRNGFLEGRISSRLNDDNSESSEGYYNFARYRNGAKNSPTHECRVERCNKQYFSLEDFKDYLGPEDDGFEGIARSGKRLSCSVESSGCLLPNDRYLDGFLCSRANGINTGDNENFVEDEELWRVPENVARLWAAEILLAVEALHQQEVTILNLNPNKILLDDNGHAQLTYVVPQRNSEFLKMKPPYSSPELCVFSPTISTTPASDIWSYGVVLYELISGVSFESRHPGTFHSHSTIGIPSKVSRDARSLLSGILKYQPSERLTVPEIKQHPFFAGVDWASLVNS